MPNQFDLTAIGATAATIEAFAAYQERGLITCRVSAVFGDQYRIYTAAGEMTAEAIGALLYRVGRSGWPAVGDWVAAQQVEPGKAMIHAVLPRRTVFSRRAAGDREQEQVIAANIDMALIVCGLDHDFNLRRIERYLTLAHASGADSAIVLNKADLCANLDTYVEQAQRVSAGAPVVAISARSREGIEPLRALLKPGLTVALLGSSGVGKSTLVNQLLGFDRQAVQEVREHDSRGRHTTTHRELLPLPGGGALIDTPGMRELQLWSDQDSLDAAFLDIAHLAEECRYRDCSHTVEHGCAVLAAIESGGFDAGRWESYQKLRKEIGWHERQTDTLAAQAQKRRWKAIHKAMRVDHKRNPPA